MRGLLQSKYWAQVIPASLLSSPFTYLLWMYGPVSSWLLNGTRGHCHTTCTHQRDCSKVSTETCLDPGLKDASESQKWAPLYNNWNWFLFWRYCLESLFSFVWGILGVERSTRYFTECGIVSGIFFLQLPNWGVNFFNTFVMSCRAAGLIQRLLTGRIFLLRFKLDVTGFHTVWSLALVDSC